MEDVFSIKDVLKKGWALTKEHLWFLLGYQILLCLIYIGISLFKEKFWWTSLVEFFFFELTTLGWIHSLLLISRGSKPSLDQLYANWRQVIWFTLGYLIYGMMIAVGLVLLIVPGIYLAVKYCLVPYYIADKDMWPLQAFKAAGEASKGLRWRLFLFGSALFGINLLGFLCLIFGIFLTYPITMIASGLVYLRLSERNHSIPTGEPHLVRA